MKVEIISRNQKTLVNGGLTVSDQVLHAHADIALCGTMSRLAETNAARCKMARECHLPLHSRICE
jgi:hypothetical protein